MYTLINILLLYLLGVCSDILCIEKGSGFSFAVNVFQFDRRKEKYITQCRVLGT